MADTRDLQREVYTSVGGLGAIRALIVGSDITVNATISSAVEINNDVGNPIPVNGNVTVSLNSPVRATFTESVVTAGTVSVNVLNGNASRRFLQVVNDSDTIVYLSLQGIAATANKGTRLNANGGNIVLDHVVPTATVSAITSADAKTILVTEG